MENKKLLVLGGTGKTGRRVVERLIQKGYDDVRIGSRSNTPPFDWERPETWAAVLEGREAVYVTFQPDLAIPSALETIQQFTSLAVKSGIRKMVLLSGRGEKEAQICEQVVMKAAPKWTMVRASWFNQNFNESLFLDPILSGTVALPRGNALEPFVDADDIAEVVVEALLDDQHNGQIYDLTGPRLLTFEEAVAEIAKATGRNIAFQPLTVQEYAQMLRDYQVPEEYIWLVVYLFEQVLDGRNSSVTQDVEKVLGRKAKDFSEYAREAAATGIWKTESALV